MIESRAEIPVIKDDREIIIPENTSFKYRPSTSNINEKSETDIQLRLENASYNYNQDLKMLKSQNQFFNKRTVKSAHPRNRFERSGLPPKQFKRISIKANVNKGLRHGKFAKFIDFLLELREDGANDTSKVIFLAKLFLGDSRKTSVSNKQFISDESMMNEVAEFENYFKLDQMRKERIRDKLLTKLDQQHKDNKFVSQTSTK